MSSPIVAVFVSSTWLDLQPERSAVEKAIQRLHETKFIGMEYFGSRDETTRRASLDEVDRSQVYVGIIGGRFGSGITADEYFRARERGLPCFIYCKNPAAIPPMWCEQEAEPKAKLADWCAELRRNHIVTEFNTPEELAAKVTADLHRWLFEVWLKPQLQQAVWQPGPQPGVQQLLEQIKDKSELPAELLAQLRQRGYQVVSGQGNIAVGDDVENSVLVSGSGNVINIYQPPANSDAPHFQPAPPQSKPKFETHERRIDAAVPSQARVDDRVDLLLQVRFPDSKLLGLEEWPLKRKPASLEKASEAVELKFPVDQQTGEVGEAQLLVKLVTPDFQIQGSAEILLDVPPDEYSKLAKFLLIPQRTGYCRINVEIYDVGRVYLGTVPIEAEVGAELVAAPAAAYNVANFYFGVAVQGAANPSSSAPYITAVPEPENFPAPAPAPAPPPGAPAAPSSTPGITGGLSPFIVPAPVSPAAPTPARRTSAWPMLMKVAAVLFVSFGVFIVYRVASPMLITQPPIITDPTPNATASIVNQVTPTPGRTPSPEVTPRVEPSPTGIEPSPTPVVIVTPQASPFIRPTLIPLKLNGIRGRVVDAQGQPLPGVLVQIEGQPNWKAETNEQGEFFVRCGETRDLVTLVAQKAGYQSWQTRVTFENGWPRQEIVLKPALELRRPYDPKRVIPNRPLLRPTPQW